ncbi:OmpH family outer membrane protein [Beggiatoa leptomitoformis]|uniref:OmpH family outer membrane protein n=1 Tax=Beggiatoa leptomitoformis TaxID=288004 RepID=A0A2N9YJ83_9GAMM|nr:OmpH family outer membrane protein [Beggiatoa leptomitoformis]AUI70577.2 OmpH family outer membrane protein [Beggiatoa leptomitoformis]
MEFPLKKFYLITGLLCSLISSSAFAELKIGFVNAVRVMESAPQVADANKRLEAEFATRQKKLQGSQQELRRLEDRLAKDGAIMSEAENRDLQRDIAAKRRDLRREQDEFREDYNIRRSEELDKLQKRIVEVVQTIAREEAYDFILSDGVVWASGKVDITEKVLGNLKKK